MHLKSLMSLVLCGHHNWEQYELLGLVRLLYRESLVWGE